MPHIFLDFYKQNFDFWSITYIFYIYVFLNSVVVTVSVDHAKNVDLNEYSIIW